MKISRFTATFLVLIACMLAVLVTRHFSTTRGALFATGVSGAGPRSVGRADAEMHIVEYIDFQCGACQQASFLLKQYIKKYPLRLSLEVKFFPLSSHPHGMTSASFAHCAAVQNKFWPVYDLLFEHQAEWSPEKEPQNTIFREYARTAGLDLKKLDACLDDPKTKNNIEEEKTQGYGAGVRSTPTFYVNGQMAVGAINLTKELDKHFGSENAPQTGS